MVSWLHLASANDSDTPLGRGNRRDGVSGVGPVDTRQIVHRDACSPAIRRRHQQQDTHHDECPDPDCGVRPAKAEVQQHNPGGHRQAIADDGEGPGVAGVALVDQAAVAAAIEVVREPRKQGSAPAVWTAPAKAAAERPQNQRPAADPTSPRRKRSARWL